MMLVVLLAISVLLFVGVNCRPPLQNVTAAITKYSTVTTSSTWTSTSHSYREYVTTSVIFTRTSVTGLVQGELGGPYVKIDGTFDYRYYGSTDEIVEIRVKAKLTNLLTVPIEKGKIFLLVTNLERTVKVEALAVFWEIKVGETIDMEQGIPIASGQFWHQKTRITLVRAEINCQPILKEVQVATQTYSKTLTESLVRTYTGIFTTTVPYETQETFMLGGTGIVVAVVAVGVAVAILVYVRTRKGAHIIAPTPVAMKYCINCGTSIPEQAKRCAKCGATQE
jgi:hypothetical protein